MPKRFTATEKWQDSWFCGLSDNNKLFWLYVLDTCNHAGIWDENFLLFGFYVKNFIFKPEVYTDRMINFTDKKWFIPKFLDFQYGKLNPENRAHASVLAILQKYGIKKLLVSKEGASKGLTSSPLGCKDKDKDKDKDKEGDCKGGENFSVFWKSYPKRLGKEAALKAWIAHKPDLDIVLRALEKHKLLDNWQEKNGKFIPYASSWINGKRWQDEISDDTGTEYDDIPLAQPLKPEVVK